MKISSWLRWFALVCLILFVAALVTCATIPTRNTDLTHFDAIVVLGQPANHDGTPSIGERLRVAEGVREFQRSVAPVIIFSGGAAYNQYKESHVMSAYAQKLGVPASAILVEDRSVNTLENIAFVEQIMDAHGWHSAEIVSSPSHLPRVALMLRQCRLLWSTHPAPTSGLSLYKKVKGASLELAVTTLDRWFGLGTQPLIHHIKMEIPFLQSRPDEEPIT